MHRHAISSRCCNFESSAQTNELVLKSLNVTLSLGDKPLKFDYDGESRHEVNRQYFLLVRLVRSTMADKRLHSAFNLENIDILDYRIAAHLLEDAGDTVVQLALQLHKTSMPPAYLKKIHGVAEEFAYMGRNVIDAFVGSDRKAAIHATQRFCNCQVLLTSLTSKL